MIRKFVEQAKATRAGTYDASKPNLHVHGAAGCCGDIKVVHGGTEATIPQGASIRRGVDVRLN